MIKSKKKLFFYGAICSILLLGLGLRFNHYAEVPFPGESRDEYSFTWLGLSLLMVGRPIATSGLSPYTHDFRYINVDSIYKQFDRPNPFAIDQPWFDHPPLFSFIPGGFAYINGVRSFADTTTTIIRKPMVLLGVVNVGLLIFYAYLIFGIRVSLIAGLLYATEPMAVISSRIVQAENLLITGFLGTLIALYLYLQKRTNWLFWMVVTLSGVFTLVKLSGISIMLSVMLLLLLFEQQQRIKKVFIVGIGTFIMLCLFPIFGALYDLKLFLQVFATNTSRYLRDGVTTVFMLFMRQSITRDFNSGYVAVGLIAATILSSFLSVTRKYAWVVAPLMCYLFIYIIFGSEGYGWYKFPFLPFLFLAIACVIERMLDSPNVLFSILLPYLAGGVMINRFINAEELQKYIWQFRFITMLLFAFVVLFLIFYKQKKIILANRLFIWSIFWGLIALNIYANSMITVDRWYNFNWLRSY